MLKSSHNKVQTLVCLVWLWSELWFSFSINTIFLYKMTHNTALFTTPSILKSKWTFLIFFLTPREETAVSGASMNHPCGTFNISIMWRRGWLNQSLRATSQKLRARKPRCWSEGFWVNDDSHSWIATGVSLIHLLCAVGPQKTPHRKLPFHIFSVIQRKKSKAVASGGERNEHIWMDLTGFHTFSTSLQHRNHENAAQTWSHDGGTCLFSCPKHDFWTFPRWLINPRLDWPWSESALD